MEDSYFKQLWNGVWHFQTPTDETIRWLVDTGLGQGICLAIIIGPVFCLFLAYCKYLDWKYIHRPEQDFRRRHVLAEKTRDFTIYDMTDEELDTYEAQLDI